jgi:hypothetical protein
MIALDQPREAALAAKGNLIFRGLAARGPAGRMLPTIAELKPVGCC